MPKVISKFQINQSQPQNSSTSNINVYYCICGEYCLILDNVIENLNKRTTDRSYILNAKELTFKLNASDGDQVLVKREKGLEYQKRFNCTRCELPLGYYSKAKLSTNSADEGDKLELTYIFEGSIVSTQAKLPTRNAHHKH